MKKTLLSISLRIMVITIATVSTISAQPNFNQTAKSDELESPVTKIEFQETSFDFGEIQEGTLVTHVFTFKNTGEEPLILIDAKGSCGCTVPEWPRDPIFPGETASITVQFNSKNKAGKRNQKVTLTANTNPQQTFVYLKGTINNEDIATEPAFDFERPEKKLEENPNCFAIYPNPTAEVLSLQMNENTGKDAIISIFSEKGELMAERKIKSAGNVIEFSVNHYPAGTYYAKVQMEGQKLESRCFLVVN